VRGALAWLVALLASCAPDYAHTAFRCDPGGCPADQTCQDGRCRRGAPTGDAGVECGKDDQGDAQVCDTHHQCCLYSPGPWRCIDAGEVCPAHSGLCDGREDCQAGDRCCADGNITFCDASCDRYACRDTSDCPSTVPSCCFDGAAPWGVCSTGC
jgi:hypothetical protein